MATIILAATVTRRNATVYYSDHQTKTVTFLKNFYYEKLQTYRKVMRLMCAYYTHLLLTILILYCLHLFLYFCLYFNMYL